MSAQIVICCGSGGVGKTTASAALALRWAIEGHRVAVLTIDPARRLADSLGIGELGNTARRVPIERVALEATGSLDAMMLDAQATFDDLVRRFAPGPEVARRILANRYYQFTSARLGGAHEYMAMEKLLELWAEGPYDIIVLDTPPTRHALDFLKAPERMSSLMDQGVLRWLVMPASSGGWRAIELGSEVVTKVLKRVLGQGTVAEIAEFFDAFRDLWEGFRERSLRVQTLLADPQTHFLLVTTPAPAARSEALFFLDVMRQRGLPFGGFLVNRTVSPPHHSLDPSSLPDEGPLAPERWAALREALSRAPDLQRQIAQDHERSIADLQRAAPPDAPCWRLPDQGVDLHDLSGLLGLAAALPPANAWDPPLGTGRPPQ